MCRGRDGRHRQFGLFDPAQAPARLAELTINSQNPRKRLEEIGLGGQLMVSGLSANVFLSALKLTQRNLSSDPKLEDVDRVIAWVQDDDGKMSVETPDWWHNGDRSKKNNSLAMRSFLNSN
jgi:hypothetical protein